MGSFYNQRDYSKFLKFIDRQYLDWMFHCGGAKFSFLYFNPLGTGFKPEEVPDLIHGLEVLVTTKIPSGKIVITELQAYSDAAPPSKAIIQDKPFFILDLKNDSPA